MKGILAIDLGATSGRAILSEIRNGLLVLTEINRFKNTPIKQRGYLCWDIDFLLKKTVESVEIASKKVELLSIGIDTWGVDYGLIDSSGKLISLPVHYRDERTKGILEKVSEYSSLADLYAMTGIQIMEINTLFQLLSNRNKTPNHYFQATNFLMMPDLLNYLLTGKIVSEESIASTTQMLDPLYKGWSSTVLKLFDLSPTLCSPIVKAGTKLGRIKEELVNCDCEVVTVLSHDTASAIASIPSRTDSPLFISSGTWSLVGTLIDKPIISDASFNYQFTNELGEDGKVTFLKNCTGLWIVEELRHQYEALGQVYDFVDITKMVEEWTQEIPIFDTDHPSLAEPGQMIEKITDLVKEEMPNINAHPAALFKSAYHSLAHKYQEVIEQVEELTQKSYQELYLIGGGSKSRYLAQLTADVTGKEVITGLSEATAIGNSLIQLVAMGQLKDMTEARELVRASFPLNSYQPKSNKKESEFRT